MLLAGAVALVLMLTPAHAASDVTHYKFWARHTAREGVSRAYSGQYPETKAIYPPITIYGDYLAGLAYRAFVDPSFNRERALASGTFTVLVKLVAVLPHLLGILVIFGLLRRRHGPRVALAAAAAYGLNPAALFDVAYWGQPDPVHALLLVVAVWLFEEERPLPGWAFVGLAAAAKPQAWVLLPFLLYVSLRRFGPVRTALGGLAAGVAGLVACLPFLLGGTFGDLLTLPDLIATTMPVASANAHNLWWLVTDARPEFVDDVERAFGPLSYRQVAIGLTLLLFAYGLWRTDPWARDGGLAAVAAYLIFGWFIVTTRAHENHDFFVLPMLAMGAPRSRFLAVAFAVISVTLLLNMVVHDFGLAPRWQALLGPEGWRRLQLLNAAVNVLLLVTWSVRLWKPSAAGRGASERDVVAAGRRSADQAQPA